MENLPLSLPKLVIDHGTPLIFVEARLLGTHTAALVSQLGLSIDAPDCSVALFAQTSGVLLVVGAGSYAAYRICTRFLGNRFISALVDAAACDALAAADRRLLYGQEDGGLAYIEEVEEDVDLEGGDVLSESRYPSRASGSKAPSEFSLTRVRRSMRARGLFSIGSRRSVREGVVRREGSGPESSLHVETKSSSSTSSSARILHGRHRIPSTCSKISDASASLKIVWEGQQVWEDEFAEESPGSQKRNTFLAARPSQRQMSASPSMGDMCSVFDDVMSMVSSPSTRGLDRERLPSNSSSRDQPRRSTTEVSSTTQGDADETVQIEEILSKHDSKYMYQSVVILGSDSGESDAMSCSSIVSGVSSRRDGSRKELSPNNNRGLWGLSHPSTSSGIGSAWQSQTTAMTDSGAFLGNPATMMNSSSALDPSHHSKATGSRTHSNVMYDSAIGGDVCPSSEEESNYNKCSAAGTITREERLRLSRRHQIGEEKRKWTPLSSSNSLEWCEDELGPERGPNFKSAAKRSSERKNIDAIVSSNSRDLMVYANEKFSPSSSQFKVLSELYSGRRLRRVGKSECCCVEALLLSAAHHQVPLLRTQPAQLIQRLRRCWERFNCIRKWKLTKDGWERNLERLEGLRQSTQLDEHGELIGKRSADGVRILMALRACELFEAKMACGVGLDWLDVERPDQVFDKLDSSQPFSELDWRLAVETFGIRLEVIDLPMDSKGSSISPHLILPSTIADPGSLRTLPFLKVIPTKLEKRVKLLPLYHIQS